jgi:3-(3-hydroxy-phenyl)propionate hydroxylase
VIVGYGPTGQAAASLLGRLGHRVCVYERWPTLYGLPRLIGFDAESARLLQAAGDIHVALRESFPIRRYTTYDGEFNPLITYEWPDDHPCGYPVKTSTYQPFIEDALDDAVRERGVRVNTGWRVTRVEQDDDGVDVTAEPWSKEELGENLKPALSKRVRARYVIAADGANSVVRESLNFPCETFPYHDAWLSVDIERRGCMPDPEQFIYGHSWQMADVGRVLVSVPAGTKRMRFEFQVDPEGDHRPLLNEDVAYRMLEERLGITREHVEIVRLTIYPFKAMLAENWRQGRVLLAGDAAHLMPPFLGEGAAAGMRDAVTLAWKLDLALRGLARESLLDTYQQERWPHVRHHLIVSVAIGEIVTERDPEIAAARNKELREGNAPPPPADPTLTEGVLMRDADGSLVSHAGELSPQGWIHKDGRTGRFDDVIGWGFQLVAADVDPLELLDQEQRAFLDEIRCHSVGVTISDRPGLALDITWAYDRWLEEHGVAAFLMRPDFYLFGTVDTVDEIPAMVRALSEQLQLVRDRDPATAVGGGRGA